MLINLLEEHHDLRVDTVDRHRVRVSLAIDAAQVAGGAGQGKARLVATVTPRALLEGEGGVGGSMMTGEEWAERENEKGHFCQCGCGERIEVKPRHRAPTVGIPRYLRGAGHNRMDMTDFVESLNAEGYLTVAQAAEQLGCGENTLRRAEDNGWMKPEWRTWGARQPMRVFPAGELPRLRQQMIDAGFRFRDDEEVLTTGQMADTLGISQTHLRWLEKKGIVPSPARGTGNRRRWLKADIPKLKRLLAKYRKEWLDAREPRE